MAVVVGAISVSVAGVAALVACADDVFSNAFAYAFIEDKIFAFETAI